MNITWHGFSCFRIEEKTSAGEASLVTDPFEPEDGKKLSRALAADVVTVSHDHTRHNNVEAVGGTPFVILGPGEYEVKDLFITGVPTFHDKVEGQEKGQNTMYYIIAEDVHIVHLGDLNHALEPKHMEEFHNIDVLMVPVGGGTTLDAKRAAEVVRQLEPRVIIPMHYKAGGIGTKLDGVEPFLKAMGLAKPEVQNKFKLAKKDLPQDEMKVVLLDPQ